MTDEFETAYAKAVELIAHFDDEFLELAALARQLFEAKPDQFKSLIAKGHLGQRKAYYLVEVDKAFGDLAQAQRIRLNKIGWTKLAIIAAQTTYKTREKLLKLAEAHTVEDLKALMRGDEPIVGRKTVLLNFTPKQHEKFAKTILKHGAIKSGDGYANKEHAVIKALRK